MARATQCAIALYLLAMFVSTVYFLVRLWPPGDQHAGPLDTRLLLIAPLAGALGAYVHLTTSFTDYAGNERLTSNWTWWYIFRPFIGMALAEIVYLGIRGGFFNAAASAATAINPYGVAAIAALTGLFSKQATDKLREVFETIFQTQHKVERKDPLPPTV